MNNNVSIFVAAGAIAFAHLFDATPASAAINCSGPVTNVEVGSGGTLSVTFNGVLWNSVICSLTGTLNGITAPACNGMQSLLMAALLSKRQVTMYYQDANSCPRGDWLDLTAAPYRFNHLTLQAY